MKLLSESNKNKLLEESYVTLFRFYVVNYKEFSRKKNKEASIFTILCIVKNVFNLTFYNSLLTFVKF